MLGPVEKALIAVLLIVLMFGMGTTLTPDRFREVARHPKAFLIGTASQFVAMPFFAYALARVLHLPNEVAVGLVLMGTCPGGTTSNLYAHLAGADVALSISMTAASKLIGVAMMPIALYLYATPFTDTGLAIPYKDIVGTLVLLLLPVGIGMAMRRKYGEGFAARAERIGGLSGIIVLAIIVVLSIMRNTNLLFEIEPTTYVAAVLLGTLGLLFGDLFSRLAGLPTDKRRAVSFETGVQNSPLAFAIIQLTFPADVQDRMMRLPMIYALFIIIQASILTAAYRAVDRRSAAVIAPEGVANES